LALNGTLTANDGGAGNLGTVTFAGATTIGSTGVLNLGTGNNLVISSSISNNGDGNNLNLLAVRTLLTMVVFKLFYQL
jgi:hypothetical protein